MSGPVTTFGIGDAVELLRAGQKIYRIGWNGKAMWLGMNQPTEDSELDVPYIYIHTTQGLRMPWNASQADLLATDWTACEKVRSESSEPPTESPQMTCAEALVSIKSGRNKARRAGWETEHWVLFTGRTLVVSQGSQWKPITEWWPNASDLFANDWIVREISLPSASQPAEEATTSGSGLSSLTDPALPSAN
jgi:hypothetical protein